MTSITDIAQGDLLKMIPNMVWDELKIVVNQRVSDQLDRFQKQLTQPLELQNQMGDVISSIEYTNNLLLTWFNFNPGMDTQLYLL